MTTTRVKVRGIYSTAITRVLLESGYSIAQPSPEILRRFSSLKPDDGLFDVLITNKDNLQGVAVSGDLEQVTSLVKLFQKMLPDAVLMKCVSGDEFDRPSSAEIEFPGGSKDGLDATRSTVLPTIARHHRLRIIDSEGLETAEAKLQLDVAEKRRLEREFFDRKILLPLRKAGIARLEHVKASGKAVRPREGVLHQCKEDRIVIRRTFSHGRYDGLDIPIEPGDYCLTDIRDGSWFVKHSYYSMRHKLKGEYYNINTPVEVYPFGARYIDLEIDVIRRPGEDPFLVDRERLALLKKGGIISDLLEARAVETAEKLMNDMCVQA